LVDSLRNVG
jgi:hypothetical protein